jgi:hypothetical protein
MSIFENAQEYAHAIHIQKFSSTTYPIDVKSPEMPEEMRSVLSRANIGLVWRARAGKGRRWWYGWSADEALQKALGSIE